MRTKLKHPYSLFFGTLANQYRIEIIRSLSKKDMNVTQICQQTGFKQPTVSSNMQRLLHCGFVTMKPNGKEKIFSLNQKTIKPLLDLMHTHMHQYCSKIHHHEVDLWQHTH